MTSLAKARKRESNRPPAPVYRMQRHDDAAAAWGDALQYLRQRELAFSVIALRCGVSPKSVMRWYAFLEGRTGGTQPLPGYARALVAAATAEYRKATAEAQF